MKHHMISADADEIVAHVPALKGQREQLLGRAMLCKRGTVFPIECVIRGYLSGSAWREYRDSKTLAGERMPDGLSESVRLETPIFSPATKAESGHDENITVGRMREILGAEVTAELERLTRIVYTKGRDVAASHGIIIADTKFEFGRAKSGEILLIDEVMTPDSSRFWPADGYAPGKPQPSFDKQPLRDWLDVERHAKRWNGDAPAPKLPPGRGRRHQQALPRSLPAADRNRPQGFLKRRSALGQGEAIVAQLALEHRDATGRVAAKAIVDGVGDLDIGRAAPVIGRLDITVGERRQVRAVGCVHRFAPRPRRAGARRRSEEKAISHVNFRPRGRRTASLAGMAIAPSYLLRLLAVDGFQGAGATHGSRSFGGEAGDAGQHPGDRYRRLYTNDAAARKAGGGQDRRGLRRSRLLLRREPQCAGGDDRPRCRRRRHVLPSA